MFAVKSTAVGDPGRTVGGEPQSSAGLPLGFSTIMVRLEFGVPWTVLLVIQAYPRSSNARFPGPPNRRSASSLPESFTLTVTVQASGISTSGGEYKSLNNVNA